MEVVLVSRSVIDTTTETLTTVDTDTVVSAGTDSVVIAGLVVAIAEAFADIEAVDPSRAAVSGTEKYSLIWLKSGGTPPTSFV